MKERKQEGKREKANERKQERERERCKKVKEIKQESEREENNILILPGPECVVFRVSLSVDAGVRKSSGINLCGTYACREAVPFIPVPRLQPVNRSLTSTTIYRLQPAYKRNDP